MNDQDRRNDDSLPEESGDRLHHLVHRGLDGELSPAERDELARLVAGDDAARREAAAFARLSALSGTTPVEAPLGFASRVMTRIAAERRPRPFPFAALVRGLALAALVLWLAALVVRPGATPSPESPPLPAPEMSRQEATRPAPAADGLVVHQFEIEAPSAGRVCLVGDFNDWKVCEVPLRYDGASGKWTIELPLPPGRHEYMFVVDEGWVTDPKADLRIDDGFGNQNAVIYL